MDRDPERHAWLALRLERDVRATLQAALLWTDSAVDGLGDDGRGGPDVGRKVRTVQRELRQALELLDELVALGRPDPVDGDRLWPRAIVVRDLLAAAVRVVADETADGALDVVVRVRPEDLHLVADPERTLRAVVELVRAGARSVEPGERLELTASGGPEASDGAHFVEIVLAAPRLSLGPEEELEPICRGMPSPDVDPRRWPAALPLAVAGRCASVLEGGLTLAEDGRRGVKKAVLRLPADRRPEQRPGWIT